MGTFSYWYFFLVFIWNDVEWTCIHFSLPPWKQCREMPPQFSNNNKGFINYVFCRNCAVRNPAGTRLDSSLINKQVGSCPKEYSGAGRYRLSSNNLTAHYNTFVKAFILVLPRKPKNASAAVCQDLARQRFIQGRICCFSLSSPSHISSGLQIPFPPCQ